MHQIEHKDHQQEQKYRQEELAMNQKLLKEVKDNQLKQNNASLMKDAELQKLEYQEIVAAEKQ